MQIMNKGIDKNSTQAEIDLYNRLQAANVCGQQLLQEYKQILQTREKQIVDAVDSVIKEVYGYDLAGLITRSRVIDVIEPRHAAMYLLRKSGLNWYSCGRVLGRNHASAVNSKKRVDDLLSIKRPRDSFNKIIKAIGLLDKQLNPNKQ